MHRVATGLMLLALGGAFAASDRVPSPNVGPGVGQVAGGHEPSTAERGEDAASPPSPSPSPPSPSPSPTGPASTPEPNPAPSPEPEAVQPLTGLPADDESTLDRAVVAVKVDNTSTARPQEGLQDADVVMVELVESATRFVALYHATDPGRLGPVRSGRFIDADLLLPFEPLLAMSGAAEPVREELREAGLTLYEVGSAGAWDIDRSRPSPHQVFLHPAPLWEAAAAEGLPPAEQPWPFAQERSSAGVGTERVAWRYPGATAVVWRWDAGARRWRRSQDGHVQHTADGTIVRADNVVVVHVPRGPNFTRPVEVVGQGRLTVLRRGRRVSGTWEKPEPEAHFVWLDEAGEPLALDPGITWIELVPEDVDLDVTDARRRPVPGVR